MGSINSYVNRKVESLTTALSNSVKKTKQVIVWHAYTRPKLVVTNAVQRVFLGILYSLNKSSQFAVYIFYTCPRNAVVWTCNIIVLVVYTKPLEYGTMMCLSIQSGILAIGQTLKYVLYTRPKECTIWFGIRTKQAALSAGRSTKYGLCTAPKEAVCNSIAILHNGLVIIICEIKYATYTYPKKCIQKAAVNTKIALENARCWTNSRCYRLKVLMYIQPKQTAKNVYTKMHRGIVCSTNTAYRGAIHTKNIFYTRPKTYTTEKVNQAIVGSQQGWKWIKGKAVSTHRGVLRATGYSFEKLHNFRNLPFAHQLCISCIMLVLLLLVGQSARIVLDLSRGDYMSAESKAGIFYIVLRGCSHVISCAWILLVYTTSIAWKQTSCVLCILGNYIWVELCHIGKASSRIVHHVANWWVTFAFYIYYVLAVALTFLREMWAVFNVVFEKYNNYREILFVGFIILMSVYCTGLVRDRMSDEDTDYDDDVHSESRDRQPGVDDVDPPGQHSVSIPSRNIIDFEVDCSDSDEEFLPHNDGDKEDAMSDTASQHTLPDDNDVPTASPTESTQDEKESHRSNISDIYPQHPSNTHGYHESGEESEMMAVEETVEYITLPNSFFDGGG